MPTAGVTGVSNGDASDQRDLGAFYAATYTRLVTLVGAISGDRQEAEEAVQDAFVRLVGHWSKVSSYDDPEAWVRKVALGYVSNRRRKLRNGIRALRRHGAEPDVAAPGTDAIDIARALEALPVPQRAAIVLQRLGFSNEAIAETLGIPTGTVKSRLARARAALQPLLREDVNGHV